MLENFLQKSPFVRAVIPFATGIATASLFVRFSILHLMIFTFALLATSIIIARKGGFLRNIWSGVTFSVVFLFAGAAIYQLKTQQKIYPEADIYCATLLETPEERPKTFRAEVLLTAAGLEDSLSVYKENIIVYFAKTDSLNLPTVGEKIIFFRTPSEITNDQNPYNFDYQGYMQRREIFRQVWLPSGSWLEMGADKKLRFRVMAEKARGFLLEIYKRNGLEGDELAILSALTLGYRKSLDAEVRQTFANSGAMHVLAVSGLHVGILFLAFRSLFSFLKRSRWGRWVYVISALLVLWGYAFITGLSPSVQRAALMFSLVQIGDGLRRPANIYNTLAASACILLAIKPVLLFEVGFQLSYSAVLGIVYFQPKLSAFLVFRNKIANYIWGLFTVSVAAQIGTFAVSSFYFKQFPVWFWITNFFVIPAAFAFIVLAAAILLFSFFPVISSFLATITGNLVSFVYWILQKVEALPGSVYAGFYFDINSLIIALGSVFALVLFMESKRKLFLFSFSGLLILFILNNTMARYEENNRKELIVYQHNEPVVHVIDGRENYLFVPSDWIDEETPFRAAENVIKALRLHKPQIIAHESDFESPRILKAGELIFFEETKIALPGFLNTDNRNIGVDYLIDFGYIADKLIPADSKIITYRFSYPGQGDSNHILLQNGAFRAQLQTK
jgi:competence protein ComEC